MRTTRDTDGKRPQRRHGLGRDRWHRWLLYPLIAVSAYWLVALAKAVPYPISYGPNTAVAAPALPALPALPEH